MSETYGIIESIKDIIAEDVVKIQTLSKDKKTLDPQEARKLTDYLKVLITSNKDEREYEKTLSLETQSNEDLEKFAKELGLIPEDKEEEEDGRDTKPSTPKADDK